MVRYKVVDALLYRCATWTPLKGHYTKLSKTHIGCCFESSKPGASRRTSVSSPTKTPSSESNARASKQPCARGGCCGRGRCSAWVTTGYPRESESGGLENAGKRGPGGRRNNGQTAWQRIFGYLVSRGTGVPPPHLTLGPGIAQYVKGAVGL